MLLVAVVAATTVFAQEDVLRPNGRPGEVPAARRVKGKGLPFRLGLEAGINYSMSSRDIVGTLATSGVNTFATGSGISPLFGLYAEVELTHYCKPGQYVHSNCDVHHIQPSYTLHVCRQILCPPWTCPPICCLRY